MNNQKKSISPRIMIFMLFFIIVIPFLPLLISQRWNWWEAWAYAVICIAGFALSRGLAARRNPDILAERARFMQHEDAAPWDKKLAPLVGLGGGLVPLAAGLDALFNWPPTFSVSLRILSLVVILAGYAMGSYALIENRYFSGMVRIQSERGHKVISSGPYRWMRHPGYVGALMTYLATPFFLDSYWALLPVGLLTVILVIRTNLEDQFLQNELEGYRDYAWVVRYRLLPGIW